MSRQKLLKIQTEELQQGTSAAVITGRQEDPGEAPWKRLKWNC